MEPVLSTARRLLRPPQREAKAADREADREGELCGEAGFHHQTRALLEGSPEAAAHLSLSGADAV